MATYDNKILKGDQLLVYTQKVKEGLASKQNKISADNKLDYSLIANTPTIPTNNNQLENGNGYQTAQQVQDAITSAISGISGFSFEIVENLPATGSTSKVYLKLKSPSETGDNIYTEYIFVNKLLLLDSKLIPILGCINPYPSTTTSLFLFSTGSLSICAIAPISSNPVSKDKLVSESRVITYLMLMVVCNVS